MQHPTRRPPTSRDAPVLVLQHLHGDGPAYLGRWLAAHGVAATVVVAEAGEPVPSTLDGFRALAILGGEMGANDDLPALRGAESLVRQALRDGVPTVGHCLGGQLIARALGARVAASPAPEIGWHPITVVDGPSARRWFGDAGRRTVFQWHHDAFELPPGAEPLATGAACPHQAFAVGPLLAMQFHVEVDAEKVDRWSRETGSRWRDAARAHPATVHDGAAIRAGVGAHLAAQQAMAARIYRRWLGIA